MTWAVISEKSRHPSTLYLLSPRQAVRIDAQETRKDFVAAVFKPVTGSGFNELKFLKERQMRHVTLEQFTDILEVMTITQSIDSGFSINHHGHVEGRPTIAISTWRGDGVCYVVD